MQLLPYLLNNKFHCWNCWGHSMGSHVFNMTNRTLYVEGIFMSVTTCMYYVFVHACMFALRYNQASVNRSPTVKAKISFYFLLHCETVTLPCSIAPMSCWHSKFLSKAGIPRTLSLCMIWGMRVVNEVWHHLQAKALHVYKSNCFKKENAITIYVCCSSIYVYQNKLSVYMHKLEEL